MIFKIDYLILYFLKSFLNDNYIDDLKDKINNNKELYSIT